MLRYKNSLLLFGGFYDTGFEVPPFDPVLSTPKPHVDVFAHPGQLLQ